MTSPTVDSVPFAVDTPDRTGSVALRPKDAASIILLDRTSGTPRFLMGRRGRGHAFMPDLYVFPGGRRDPRDHALPFRRDLHPLVTERLLSGSTGRRTVTGARALALAAIRELQEETGLFVKDAKDEADLLLLRYIARAITPPGNVRRFDTHFFLLPIDEAGIATTDLHDSEELQDLRWVGLDEVPDLNVPRITQAVLGDVKTLLDTDPTLPYGMPVPFYSMRYGRFVRTHI